MGEVQEEVVLSEWLKAKGSDLRQADATERAQKVTHPCQTRKSVGEKNKTKTVLCGSESRVSGRNHKSSQHPIRQVQRSAGWGGKGGVEITRTAGECFTCFYSLIYCH